MRKDAVISGIMNQLHYQVRGTASCTIRIGKVLVLLGKVQFSALVLPCYTILIKASAVILGQPHARERVGASVLPCYTILIRVAAVILGRPHTRERCQRVLTKISGNAF